MAFFIEIFEIAKRQVVSAGKTGPVPPPALDGFFGWFDLTQLEELQGYLFLLPPRGFGFRFKFDPLQIPLRLQGQLFRGMFDFDRVFKLLGP